MQTSNRHGLLVGRFLIALIFIVSGFGKITGFDATVGYIADKGLPMPTLGAIGADHAKIMRGFRFSSR